MHRQSLDGCIRSGFVVPLGVLVFAILGCANTTPEVQKVIASVQVKYQVNTKAYVRTLSVFSQLNDQDGIEDIDTMYILNDQRELLWLVQRSEWETFVEGAKTWIGQSRLAIPYGEPIPRGPFRLIVEDRAGHQTERSFSINLETRIDEQMVPRLTKASEFYRIEPSVNRSEFRRFLVAYDASGAERSRIEVTQSQILLRELPAELQTKDLSWQVLDYYAGGEVVLSSGLW